MFQIDWAQKTVWEEEKALRASGTSHLTTEAVRSTALLHWEEHCLECAIPGCYSTCSLYVPRADKKCSRFAYGIYPNPNFSGLFEYGADVRFRRWGKLETRLYGKSVSLGRHHLLDRVSRALTRPLSRTSGTARSKAVGKTFFAKIRNKYLVKIAPSGDEGPFDAFVLECFSPEEAPYRITLEYVDRAIRARHSFTIQPGWNFFTLPAESFNFDSNLPTGKLTLCPENNAETRIIFTWLDLVRYQDAHRAVSAPPPRTVPAAKVKCVAWDLDNTVWRGIVSEDSQTALHPRADALDLIRKLDERGIIQTVVSKNNFADAWRVVESLQLQEYFLHPAINWQPKSSNLVDIAARLNINIDTFALIDDSPFERAEVQSTLPQVRVYSDDQIEGILSFAEFDVPVTEASKKRRVSYLTEIRREKEKEASGGDYEAFLRGCKMRMRLFVPREESHIQRCLELIQRANQLNLSNTRYAHNEFQALLSRPGVLCLAMDCEDRFGEYGIVGFASIDETPDDPVICDLVLSCRVAQKRVEHTLVQWLASRARGAGAKALRARLVRTERNQPILQVFDDLHFRSGKNEEQGIESVELPLDARVETGDVVVVETSESLSLTGHGEK
jgi:FkbH-like protein